MSEPLHVRVVSNCAYPAHNDLASTCPKREYTCDLNMSLLLSVLRFPSHLVDIIPCHHNVITFTCIVTISNNDVALRISVGLGGIPSLDTRR